jgi:hypothetical protein
MNANGGDNHVILGPTRFSIEPRWSVRGQIVFASLVHGSQFEIYRMNANGTGLVQLTFTGINSDPRWSPGGTRISFGSDRQRGGKVNLFIMDADGRHVTELTRFGPPAEAGDSDWPPDRTKIAVECRGFEGAELEPTPHQLAAIMPCGHWLRSLFTDQRPPPVPAGAARQLTARPLQTSRRAASAHPADQDGDHQELQPNGPSHPEPDSVPEDLVKAALNW